MYFSVSLILKIPTLLQFPIDTSLADASFLNTQAPKKIKCNTMASTDFVWVFMHSTKI